jgi:hypothetical protein
MSESNEWSVMGNPSQAGNFTFTLEVQDSKGRTARRNFTIRIKEGLQILSWTVPNGLTGEAYSFPLQAQGGAPPYSWSWENTPYFALPPGLSLNPSGTLSGTPTATGGFRMTVHVTDSQNRVASGDLTIWIVARLEFPTDSLPRGNIAVPYYALFPVNGGGGNRSWTLELSSKLPAGLRFGEQGFLAGTPSEWGTFPVTVTVQDSGPPSQTASGTFTLEIENNLVIPTSDWLPDGVVTKPYSQSVQAAGGMPPYAWRIVLSDPANPFAIDSLTGRISGVPSQEGAVGFTVLVSDASLPQQNVQKDFHMHVNPLPFFYDATFPDGVEGLPYLRYFGVSGGIPPYALRVVDGQLPEGMSVPSLFEGQSASLSGTPSKIGTYNFTLELTDASLPVTPATKSFSVRINERLRITTTVLPEGNLADPYQANLTATGGVPPYFWYGWSPSITGLNLSRTTGVVSGVPLQAYSGIINIQLMDSANFPQYTSDGIPLNIKNLVKLRTTKLPSGRPSVPYKVVLTATGGVSPLRWTVESGSLPEALNLMATTGEITGTPSRDGEAAVTIRVTDSSTPPVYDERPLTFRVVSDPGRNDEPATATPISNGTFRASISPYADPVAGPANPDHDYYQLTAAPGTVVTIETMARRLVPESFLDSVIEIVDIDSNRFTTCRTPNGTFDLPCLNDDIQLGVVQDSQLEFKIPDNGTATPVTFFVHVFSFNGSARPDYVYDLIVSGAN